MIAWQTTGRLDNKKGALSANTIRHFLIALKAALSWAVDQDYVPSSPADKVAPPHVPDKEISIISPEQSRNLLSTVEGTELHLRTMLALSCGLRRSEALGATCDDVNLSTARLTVRRAAVMNSKGEVRIKGLKSRNSARTLVVPAFALAVLKRDRVKRIQKALAAGEQFETSTCVCIRDDGKPWKPHDLSREFARAIRRHGLPRVSYHGLRHSFATLSLQSGTDLKHTSAALGHSGVGITGRIYAHVTEVLQEEAAARLDNLLGRATADDCDPNVTQAGSAG